MAKGYAVLLSPECPPAILELFDGYLRQLRGMNFLFCDSATPGIHYVDLIVLKQSGGQPWNVSIQCPYVIAIVDASKKKNDFGFAPRRENEKKK